MAKAIKIENLSKAYQLGEFSTGTLSRDIERWWALIRGREDPFLRVGEVNDRTQQGKSNIVWSLKDISCEIEQGTAVGIIGRNGAGKSTLLKILSRVTTPTTGAVKVKGRIASLLEVGTGFHPELTGRENIFLNGAILGMRKQEIKTKFNEIVDFAGVERYIDTPVKRYSSGMYVRLAFAVAAHLESEILIVDEVLAVGDAEFQKKCLGKMGEVSKAEGRTVLFVSHNMASINALCNYSALLNNGKLTDFGNTKSVIESYLKSKSPHKNIAERTDRKGDQQIKLLSVQFRNAVSNEIIYTITSGDEVIIELELEKAAQFRPRDIEVGLGISDIYDHRITLISNRISGQSIIVPKANNSFMVRIVINKLSLACGNYSVTTFIASDGHINDWIFEAFTISIETDSFFNTSAVLPPDQGHFYLDYNFIA
jgi:lipopolysaccharide transport system ATP-binding protein